MSRAPQMIVTVRSRQGLLFEGDAESVSSENSVGPFDVLPEHINFVSMVSKRVVVRAVDGRVINLPLDKGVIWVEKNNVRVFMGVAKT